jgi:hypothetical protein
MSLLNSLVNRFEKTVSVIVSVDAKSQDAIESVDKSIDQILNIIDNDCPHCSDRHYWQPYHSQAWYCANCKPPPMASVVARERRNGVTIERSSATSTGQSHRSSREAERPPESDRISQVDVQIVNAGYPICHECFGQVYVETAWSDGTVDCKCWSCREGATKTNPGRFYLNVTMDSKLDQANARRDKRKRERERLG